MTKRPVLEIEIRNQKLLQACDKTRSIQEQEKSLLTQYDRACADREALEERIEKLKSERQVISSQTLTNPSKHYETKLRNVKAPNTRGNMHRDTCVTM